MDYTDLLNMLYENPPPAPQERTSWVNDVKSRKGVWFRATIESVSPSLMEYTFHLKQQKVSDSNHLRVSARKKKLVNPTQQSDPAHRRALNRIRQRTNRG